MSHQLPNEAAVLAAIRGFLSEGLNGRDTGQAMDLLTSETSRTRLSSLDIWERIIRGELYAAAQRKPTSHWKIWSKPALFASWLDLCSSDGFRRERILRSLSSSAP